MGKVNPFVKLDNPNSQCTCSMSSVKKPSSLLMTNYSCEFSFCLSEWGDRSELVSRKKVPLVEKSVKSDNTFDVNRRLLFRLQEN